MHLFTQKIRNIYNNVNRFLFDGFCYSFINNL